MHAPDGSPPLASLRIVSLAQNLPGPACVRRLADWGALVTKVESPEADPLRAYARDYYRALHEGIEVRTLDLKTDDGFSSLSALLENAHLLVTAQRPAALKRLGLDFANIRRLWPHLSQLAIVGYAPPDEDVPGHDLTYLAQEGLLQPPLLPPTLMADLLGAERAVSATLLLLKIAEQTGIGEYSQVALADAASVLAGPHRFGLTRPGGLLGGAHLGYQLYRTANGWLALAALEPRFLQSLTAALGIDEPTRDAIARSFSRQDDDYWRKFALQHDVPLVVLPAARSNGA